RGEARASGNRGGTGWRASRAGVPFGAQTAARPRAHAWTSSRCRSGPIVAVSGRMDRCRAIAMPQPSSRLLHVLVVDDDPPVRELLVEYFRERGHEVTAIASGAEAISELERRASTYSLIISDLQLPGTDGLGVLRTARTLNPG